MSSGQSTYSKPALTSTLTPESPCLMLYLQVMTACGFAKQQFYFAHLRMTRRLEGEKKIIYILSKKYYKNRLCRPKSLWFLTRWVEIPNSLCFSSSPGQKHSLWTPPELTVQTILPLKESCKMEFILLKLGPSSITMKNWADKRELFYRAVSFL